MKSLGGHFILMIISLLKQKAFIFLIYDKLYQLLTIQCSVTGYLGYLKLILSSRISSTLVDNSKTKANLYCI